MAASMSIPLGEGGCSTAQGRYYHLLTLPVEVIMAILSFADTRLLITLGRVCSRLRSLAADSYKGAYGPGPLHRQMNPIDYRALAIEQAQFRSDGPADSPDGQTTGLLSNFYRSVNDVLSDAAGDALL